MTVQSAGSALRATVSDTRLYNEQLSAAPATNELHYCISFSRLLLRDGLGKL